MFRSSIISSLLLIAAIISCASAFTSPSRLMSTSPRSTFSSTPEQSKTILNIFGEDGGERPKLTRENEPDEYFSSEMDRMSDEEKIPVAIAGLVGISLPFIAGLIFLYTYK